MRGVIFDNETDAQNLCDELFTKVDYKDEITTKYADPRKHPTLELWAVPIRGYVMEFVTDYEVVVLTEDWFEPVNNQDA